jgi:hypothetical protein
MPKIFISYRTSDESFAAVHLDDHLCARFGAENIFRDSRAIPPGKDFERELWDALEVCRLLIVVVGRGWVTDRLHSPDDYVRREIAFALKRNIDAMPVLVGGAPLPDPSDLPEDIRALHLRQYRRMHARSSKSDTDAIIAAVEQVLGEQPSAGAEKPGSGPAVPGIQFQDLHGDLVMGDKVGGNKNVWTR